MIDKDLHIYLDQDQGTIRFIKNIVAILEGTTYGLFLCKSLVQH